MRRVLLVAAVSTLFINTSCERCKRCTYSYTKTEIIETPSGEEEVETTVTNQVLDDDEGIPYGEECLKYSEYKGDKEGAFVIDDFYEIESQQTDLEDFEYTCVDL